MRTAMPDQNPKDTKKSIKPTVVEFGKLPFLVSKPGLDGRGLTTNQTIRLHTGTLQDMTDGKSNQPFGCFSTVELLPE